MTRMEAAEWLAKEIRKTGNSEAEAWDYEKVKRLGWGGEQPEGTCAVCAEGTQMAEMQVWEQGPFKKGMQPCQGVFMEPWSEWLMYIYEADVKEEIA